MKEIKFAWICRNIKFDEIKRVELTDEKLLSGDRLSWITTDNCEIIAKILPTGQKTKGVEIWEGDIVQIFDGGYSQGTYRIVWDNMNLKWYLSDANLEKDEYYMDLGEFSWCPDDLEIIGNVYQDKELLNGK